MPDKEYVLITPVRNEELYIEKVIESILGQSILPKKWVIVSDSSGDRTDEIVTKYAGQYDFIEFIRKKRDGEREFASKVNAFEEGYRCLVNVDYDFIGNLDGDVSLPLDYYEKVIERFQEKNGLGIAGGMVHDFYKGSFYRQYCSLNSVAGAVQLFRRECYEDIGGYIGLKGGLVDAVAEVRARMLGWETRSFPELKVYHHRNTGSEGRNLLSMALREGKLEYMFGYHPVFHLARGIQRIAGRPVILGTVLRTCSYLWCYMHRKQRPVSDEFIKYLRAEEWEKLKSVFLTRAHRRSSSGP